MVAEKLEILITQLIMHSRCIRVSANFQKKYVLIPRKQSTVLRSNLMRIYFQLI